MATGTGKTLIAAAVSKLFLKTGNAKRVLFLVDRLELEDQANKRFIQFLMDESNKHWINSGIAKAVEERSWEHRFA
jgi:type I site-specific restriction endonuclease